MWLPISVHMAERTRVSSWQGPLRGVTLGVWFWSPPGNDSSASGTSRPVLLGWNKMAFLGVAQARPSADVLSPAQWKILKPPCLLRPPLIFQRR